MAAAPAASAAAAAGNINPAIFLTLGHGDDDIEVNFESRIPLPEGFTLVTLAQCGVVTTADSVYPIMDAFCNPDMQAFLQDPLTNKAGISELIGGTPLNVYTSGDSIPDLGLHLFLEWIEKPRASAPKSDPQMRVQQSGVYKFPVIDCFDFPDAKAGMDPKNKYISASWFLGEPMLLGKKEEILPMYKNSLLPTVDEVNTILDETGMGFKKIKKATYHKLSSVFKRLGPGVYYFVVCRSVHDNGTNNIGNLTKTVMSYNRNNENTDFASASQYIKDHYDEFSKIRNEYKKSLNRIQHYPSIFPYVLSQSEVIRKEHSNDYFLDPKWNSAYLNDPRFLKYKYRTVTRTRRKSLNQQQKYGAAAAVSEVVGGAGEAAPAAAVNFKPLNEDSSLNEVLSELPHYQMRGVNDEIMLREYESMIARYPQFRSGITNEMYRIIIDSIPLLSLLPGTNEEKLAKLYARLASITHVFSGYPELAKSATKKVYRAVMNFIPHYHRLSGSREEKLAELDAHLALIAHVFGSYPDLVESATADVAKQKLYARGGGHRTRKNRRNHRNHRK